MMKHPLWTAALLVIYALCCVYLLLTIFGEIPVLPWTFSWLTIGDGDVPASL